MQPNFEQMTNKELIAYALAHRQEIEPLRILYSRRTPDSEATWYGPMTTEDGTPIAENIRIAEEAIKQRVKQIQLHHEAKMQNQALSNSDSWMFLQDANNQENQISQESLDNIEVDKT